MSDDTNGETTETTAQVDTVTEERYTGRCKWFNNKAGYGFVTIVTGPRVNEDIFVHHSVVRVDQEQYKYLVQGEYVEFTLVKTDAGKHEFQAGDVSGIAGGQLMCETRFHNRSERVSQSDSQDEPHGGGGGGGGNYGGGGGVHIRGPGPREGEEWMLVKRSTRQPRGGDYNRNRGGRGGGRGGGGGESRVWYRNTSADPSFTDASTE